MSEMRIWTKWVTTTRLVGRFLVLLLLCVWPMLVCASVSELNSDSTYSPYFSDRENYVYYDENDWGSDQGDSSGQYYRYIPGQRVSRLGGTMGNLATLTSGGIDFGGMLSALNLRQGASLLGLVFFPFLFPLFTLLGAVLLVIFVVGSIAATSGGTVVTTGRRKRFERDLSSALHETFASMANLTQTVVSSSDCIEKMSCEISKRMRSLPPAKSVVNWLHALKFKKGLLDRISESPFVSNECEVYKCQMKQILNKAFKFKFL